MEKHTQQTPATENPHDDWILVSEDEKAEETPEKAEASDRSGYLSILIFDSSEESSVSEDERLSEENEAMRHAEARERVKKNLFGKRNGFDFNMV